LITLFFADGQTVSKEQKVINLFIMKKSLALLMTIRLTLVMLLSAVRLAAAQNNTLETETIRMAYN